MADKSKRGKNLKNMRTKIFIAVILLFSVAVSAKKVKKEVFTEVNYGVNNKGTTLVFTFEKGKEYNHPLFAVWLADENGNYIQTLYVSESIGKGVFSRISRQSGQWMPGEIQRPAALPYWVHQRNVKNEFGGLLPTSKNPVPDAYTGATPKNSFILQVKTVKPLDGKYKVMFEINQSWDWNEFWHNDKYPQNPEYKTSSQPALVYSADIDTKITTIEYLMKPVGHSHYAGDDGSLNTNLSTLTTALRIAKRISVRVE
jgi:hypothetical protein